MSGKATSLKPGVQQGLAGAIHVAEALGYRGLDRFTELQRQDGHLARGKGVLSVHVPGEESGLLWTAPPDLRGDSSIRIDGCNSFVLLGRGVRMSRSQITIRADDSLVIIGDDCRLGGPTKIFVTGAGGFVGLGQGTTVESGTLLSGDGAGILLGEDCMLSNGIVIRTSDGHGIWDLETQTRLSFPGPVTIGHHVWLGNGVSVSKGVVIGDGAIVGQRSLVTRDLAPRSLNVGSPAKAIRQNVSWSRRGPVEGIPMAIREGRDWD